MGEVIPAVLAFALILPNGSPLTFAQAGSPFFPVSLFHSGFLKSRLFGVIADSSFTGLILDNPNPDEPEPKSWIFQKHAFGAYSISGIWLTRM